MRSGINKAPMKLALSLLALLVSVNAHAISETGYADAFKNQVLPFYQTAKDGTFQGQASASIHYVYFKHPQSRGSVVVANGYTENVEKYAEVAFDLYAQGYSVFMIDHRGQGQSSRLIPDGQVAYIDDFSYLVADLKTLIETVVKPNSDGQALFLLAHSMGGGIGAAYLEAYPQDFAAAVLSAPMLGIRLPNWDKDFAIATLRTLNFLGQGKNIAWGKTKKVPYSGKFDGNELTHSLARYQMAAAATLVIGNNTIQAPANDWVLRALVGSDEALKGSARVKTPVLLFQAGKDTFVTNPEQTQFCSAIEVCQLVPYAQASHEIFMEVDAVRSDAFQRMVNLFNSYTR